MNQLKPGIRHQNISQIKLILILTNKINRKTHLLDKNADHLRHVSTLSQITSGRNLYRFMRYTWVEKLKFYAVKWQ